MNSGSLRKCKICGQVKPLSDFPKHGGNTSCRYWRCRECYRKKQREYLANRGEEARQIRIEKGRIYREKNKEELLRKHREYYRRNRERLLEQKKIYSNKKEVKKHRIRYEQRYWKKRREEEPVVDMRRRCRYRLHSFMQRHGSKKPCKTQEMIGCGWDELCEHLLATWQRNYGEKWNGEAYHIDHIIPLATAKTDEDVVRLFHYTNLQMLKPVHNLDKKDKLNYIIKEK